jgi:Na+(H+)/acetate symporter ActP
MVTVNESWLDYFIIAVYFVFVLGIGAVLRTKMQTSEDYFLSGRSLPSWITGLAFLGANLGALEIMGMGDVRDHAVPLLLDRRDPGDVLRGPVHDPLLLRE